MPDQSATVAAPAPLPAPAALKLWKCWNPDCMDEPPRPGHDFMNASGECEKCGAHPKHPRAGHLVTPRVVIHFMGGGVPSTELPKIKAALIKRFGTGTLACTGKPRKTEQYTGVTLAVSCPYCQATPEFKSAVQDAGVNPDFDLPLEIDLKKGLITQTGGCG